MSNGEEEETILGDVDDDDNEDEEERDDGNDEDNEENDENDDEKNIDAAATHPLRALRVSSKYDASCTNNSHGTLSCC